MLLDDKINKLFESLVRSDTAQIDFAGAHITIRLLDSSNKIALAAPVFHGENYIPKSVRRCLSQRPPFMNGTIKTYLSVDEGSFRVALHYLGHVEGLNPETFQELLEEFGGLAENWRSYLDEHGRHDLIHVRVK